MSILDDVHRTNARVLATTHYPELKAYGYNREGVMNASVEFDIETLSPTYKLLIGVPGRSNAFEISKRLGLPDHIIGQAKSEMTAEHNEVDTMIASLEQSKNVRKKSFLRQNQSEKKRKNCIKSCSSKSSSLTAKKTKCLKRQNSRLLKK